MSTVETHEPLPVRKILAFGTSAAVCVTDPHAMGDAEALLQCEIQDMDAAASRFRPDSEVLHLCMNAGTSVSVSPLLFEAVRAAIWVAEWSDGAVDPSVGSHLMALGYDRDFRLLDQVTTRRRSKRPATSFTHTWRSIELDAENQTVKVPKGMLLDLGASAKALTADRAARSIAELTDTGALVSIGGDVSVAGPPPECGWSIGIASRSDASDDLVDQVVSVSSGGLASSGTQARTWRSHGDRIVHHIVDPITGLNPSECWSLVSVAGSSCLIANAASTAAIVWGSSAPKRLSMAGLPARLVSSSGAVTTVCGWPEKVGPHAPSDIAS